VREIVGEDVGEIVGEDVGAAVGDAVGDSVTLVASSRSMDRSRVSYCCC